MKFAHLRVPIEHVKEQLPQEVSIVDDTYCGIKSMATFVDNDYGEFRAVPYKVIKGKQFHPLRSKKIKTKRQTKNSGEFLHSLRDGVVLDETTYTNAKTKCKLLDPEYGEFWITPVSYLTGHNHPKRGNLNRKIQILSKSEEKFKSRLPNNIKLVPGTWNGYKSAATFIVDGKEVIMLASSMLNKINGGAKSKGVGPITATPVEEVIKKLPSELTLDLSTYKGVGKKARFVDSEYGEWWTTPSTVLNGGRHPKRPKSYHKRTLSLENIKSRLPSHIKIIDSSYIAAKQRAIFIDSEYGEFESIVTNVLRGHGHPGRAHEQLYYTADDVAKVLPPEVSLIKDSYTNTYTKARFIDSEYGEFEAYPRDILRGCVRHPGKYHSKLEAIVDGWNIGLLRSNQLINDVGRHFRPDFKIHEKAYLNVDGLYWHKETHRYPRYHFDVREEFEKVGFKVYQFREDEVLKKPDIIKSMVCSELGKNQKVYARSTVIKEVSQTESHQFFEVNHLMGALYGCKAYGLYYKEKLVMAISIRRSGSVIELGRMATLTYQTVVGGLSKLLNQIVGDYDVDEIHSWVDLRYATGKSLKLLGFVPIRETLGYSYTDNKVVYNRRHCRANMDERGLSEREQAEEFGWSRIYDAGQRLFVLKMEKVRSGKA